MAESICECPFCRRKFRVPAEGAGDRMLCPHCRQVVDLRRLSDGIGAKPVVADKPPPKIESPNVEPIVTDCPNCSGKFHVLASMFGQSVACPHCRAPMQLGPPPTAGDDLGDYKIQTGEASQAMFPTSGQATESQFPKHKRKAHDSKKAPGQIPRNITASEAPTSYNVGVANKTVQAGSEQIAAAAGPAHEERGDALDPELAKLLPPKFLVLGSLQRMAKSLGATHVILPDAECGFKAVDASVRQIRIGGQTVAITRVSPSRKRLRRKIRSIILFAVCMAILFVAFYLLNR